MLKTVFFDIDDTLLDFHAAEERALRKTLETLGLDPTPETCALYSRINAGQWKLLEAGSATRAQIITRRFDILFAELGVLADSFETQKLYESLLAQGHDLMPGAIEVLTALRGRYGLYIVSNGSAAVQDSRIALSGLAEYFEDIFISERIGYDKPRAEFFEVCFSRIPGFSRESAVIVGDSLTSDIRGGINAGIRTCWYNSRGNARDGLTEPDYEVAALAELPALFDRL